MIFTSYFANVKKLPSNVVPIAICINPPRAYAGLWYPKLAPDYDILRRYKRDGDVEDYTKIFTRSVLDNLSIVDVLCDIEEMLPMDIQQQLDFPYAIEKSPDFHVALVCYEKSDDFCHRHLVADWFKKKGVWCREWKNETN